MDLLYLAHRLPYPPNKGDKVRSFHLLAHLAARHRVYLGTFVDDPEDEVHVDAVRSMCAGVHAVRLNPLVARLRSTRGLLGRQALTLRYYDDASLRRWVDDTVAGHDIRTAVVFSSSMAQYVHRRPGLRVLVDFVDVDSAKWTQYAPAHRWPMSWVYRREGRRLLDHERCVAAGATRSFFVTDQETALFQRLAPGSAASVEAMGNGVDAAYFAPAGDRPSPYPDAGTPIVFTGAMDYWPNVDAVTWFATHVLPKLRAARPHVRFYIVGRHPTPAVRALAGDGVVITGGVPDVRPWLQHAAVAVAPLRLARGIQNKILEAMAMGTPVIAATPCAEAIDAVPGAELLAAQSEDDWLDAVDALLDDPAAAAAMGRAGRARVLRSYGWSTRLSAIDEHLDARAEVPQ
jgi:sugar transferase (PEP-CTERM/EpsH1 system associated)